MYPDIIRLPAAIHWLVGPVKTYKVIHLYIMRPHKGLQIGVLEGHLPIKANDYGYI